MASIDLNISADLRRDQKRLYILGMGNVGIFIAHSIAGIPNAPPITILLRRDKQAQQFEKNARALRVTTDSSTNVRSGFDYELLDELSEENINSEPSDRHSMTSTAAWSPDAQHDARISSDRPDMSCNAIRHLIVTTKAGVTARALKPWAHRLSAASSILFLQNGAGIIDEVNDNVFPTLTGRPEYMLGVNTHGLRQANRSILDVVHTGKGTIALGILPSSLGSNEADSSSLSRATGSSQHILRTMTRTPILGAVAFPAKGLFLQQLDKLAVNSVVNPLTALFGCTNGALLHNYHITRVMRLLLAEISLVIQALPELKSLPNTKTRFGAARLESLVLSVIARTAGNRSSMLEDVTAQKSTEIDYINGYIVRRGEELGIHCMMNYLLVQMVKAKQAVAKQDEGSSIPFIS